VTLFPFVAQPAYHLIVKPRLMKRAAERLGFELTYRSQPNAKTYAAVMNAAKRLKTALASWHPRDLIDVQGFIWVTSSDEYETWPWERSRRSEGMRAPAGCGVARGSRPKHPWRR
jgi:hypothetical protein